MSPIRHIESLAPALAELERALVWASKTIDDVPDHLVPVVQTRGKKSKCMGWFSANQWSTREGEPVHEISFCAESLQRDPVEIVATAVHEMVHLWCHFLQLKETSTGGRHNKVFREYAEILGLECASPYDSYGFGYTTPTKELQKRIEKEFQPDVAAFNLFRVLLPGPEKKPSKTRRLTCGCTVIRVAAKVKFDATCNLCDNTFQEDEE